MSEDSVEISDIEPSTIQIATVSHELMEAEEDVANEVSDHSNTTSNNDLIVSPGDHLIFSSNVKNGEVSAESTNSDNVVTPVEVDATSEELPNETITANNAAEFNSSDLLTEDSIAPSKKMKLDHTEKLCQFPLGRIKDIMKSDPDISLVNAECVFLITKATEMFLQQLGKEIHAVTLKNKKKTLQRKDLDAAILENPAFEFLEGALD